MGSSSDANTRNTLPRGGHQMTITDTDLCSRSAPCNPRLVPNRGHLQVLSLDGGGLRGIFLAAALAVWEEDFGKSFTDHFDLIVGTSTGGIVAIGLGLGMSPAEILTLYLNHADQIFPTARRKRRAWLKWVWRPRYESGELRAILQSSFGDRLLGDSRVRLAIPSYDLTTDNVHLFRTPHHPVLRRDWRVRAVDVALATSAAPVFLPMVSLDNQRLIDGGVWANNPILVGVAECFDRLGGKRGHIRVLSLGTTTEIRERRTELDTGGLWAWSRELPELLLRGQSLAANNHAQLILGRDAVVRVDVSTPSGLHKLDNVSVKDLIGRAQAESRVQSPAVSQFLKHKPTPYEPCYKEVNHQHDGMRLRSLILESSVEMLDISPEQYQVAVERYRDIGNWLVSAGFKEPDVYPQGSFRLGTVLRPTLETEFDIDLVFLQLLGKESITQQGLRLQAGGILERYIASRGPLVGNPTLKERKRCWTLIYAADRFHMDVLPVIPDPEGERTAILLTDRDLLRWQHSNPIGYANWFWSRMGNAVEEGRTRLAALLTRDVEEVPQWLIRTPLQRVVQLLKLHRDTFFRANPEKKPASILITTLAGRAYDGQRDLFKSYRSVANRLQFGVEKRRDGYWVPNPAHDKENFADRWNSDPERKTHFDRWVETLLRDLDDAGTAVGGEVIRSLSRSHGAFPVEEAARTIGAGVSAASAAGGLGVSATGRVSPTISTKSRGHTFYGQQQHRRPV